MRVNVLFSILLISFLITSCAMIPKDITPPETIIEMRLEELQSKEPNDPTAIIYNSTTDKYEIKSGYYKKALEKMILNDFQIDSLEIEVAHLKAEKKYTLWQVVKIAFLFYLSGVATGLFLPLAW